MILWFIYLGCFVLWLFHSLRLYHIILPFLFHVLTFDIPFIILMWTSHAKHTNFGWPSDEIYMKSYEIHMNFIWIPYDISYDSREKKNEFHINSVLNIALQLYIYIYIYKKKLAIYIHMYISVWYSYIHIYVYEALAVPPVVSHTASNTRICYNVQVRRTLLRVWVKNTISISFTSIHLVIYYCICNHTKNDLNTSYKQTIEDIIEHKSKVENDSKYSQT